VDEFSNQQGNGAGIILEGPNRLFIEKALTFAFKASNNQAEYEALVVGMLLAKELGAQSLLVKSDSLLVTGQVTSEYHAKDPQMASYLRYVTLLRETFPTFKLVHVPREQNARADLLAKLASSDKVGQQRSVIQETLKSPRTITDGAVEVSHVKTFDGQLGKRKDAPIVDTKNVEGAQVKRLPPTGRRFVGSLTCQRSGDLDDALSALPS